jgi:hypothetical protein
MREIIILTIATGLTFLFFLVILILSLTKKKRSLKLASLALFIAFVVLTGWTAYRFVSKTYNKVTESMKPRTGDEIYDALFDKRQTACVKVINYQDQVVPKIDYAIWLQFETCPNELKRILSRHEFTTEKISTEPWNEKIPLGETLNWFDPTTLGDTILVNEYATEDRKNIQTIWANLDSTKVFVRDILD